jgi:hypothetical protein
MCVAQALLPVYPLLGPAQHTHEWPCYEALSRFPLASQLGVKCAALSWGQAGLLYTFQFSALA